MHEQGSGFSSTFRGTGSRVPSHVKNVEGNTCRRPRGGEVNSNRYSISQQLHARYSREHSRANSSAHSPWREQLRAGRSSRLGSSFNLADLAAGESWRRRPGTHTSARHQIVAFFLLRKPLRSCSSNSQPARCELLRPPLISSQHIRRYLLAAGGGPSASASTTTRSPAHPASSHSTPFITSYQLQSAHTHTRDVFHSARPGSRYNTAHNTPDSYPFAAAAQQAHCPPGIPLRLSRRAAPSYPSTSSIPVRCSSDTNIPRPPAAARAITASDTAVPPRCDASPRIAYSTSSSQPVLDLPSNPRSLPRLCNSRDELSNRMAAVWCLDDRYITRP